jgi:ABC-2 family transporter protein
MSFLVWRLYRAQAVISLALLAAFTALLLATGFSIASQWHSALVTCGAAGSCGGLSNTLFLGSHSVGFLVIMTLGVPAVLGALCGAPLIAHEYETKTTEFAWTQGITRRRWLIVKAGWLLLAAAVLGGVVSGLVTWWSGPDNALQADAFGPGRFDIMGVVPVAYTVFAMAVGIAAGLLTRRTIPAIGLTLAVYLAVRLLIDQWVRPHYLAAVTHVYGLMQNWVPSGAVWQLGAGVVDPAGHALPMTNGADIGPNVPVSAVPASCATGASQAVNNQLDVLSCMQRLGYRQFVSYQPANRYWLFQGIEAGVFVALTAALLAITYLVLTRRDA